MPTHVDRTSKTESPTTTVDSRTQTVVNETGFSAIGPIGADLQALKTMADQSPRINQLKVYQTMADKVVVQRQVNNTGLPDNLKSGIENLSGYSMNDVKVHYNSDKPAQLNAHAYAQGTTIHLASGQEKHLPHEAWHVVQQKQGRVQPTKQLKGKVAINDDAGLEREADVMGEKALQMQSANQSNTPVVKEVHNIERESPVETRDIVQGMFYEYDEKSDKKIFHYGPVIPLWWTEKVNANGEQEKEQGYGIWVRKFTPIHAQQMVEQSPVFKNIMDKHGASLSAIESQVGNIETAQSKLKDVFDIAKIYMDELEAALMKYAAFSLAGIAITAGVAALADYFLSLPNIPLVVKAAIDIAGLLYGAFVSHRWMKSTLLPLLAKVVLVPLNTLSWASTIYFLITEALKGEAFQQVHIAAMPFAITIELILRNILAHAKEIIDKRESSIKTPLLNGNPSQTYS
jgi:Domain of unknown function (DUF4157)